MHRRALPHGAGSGSCPAWCSLTRVCRNASSSLICVFSLWSSSACFDSVACAPRVMLRSLSSSDVFARSLVFSSLAWARSVSSCACFSATALRSRRNGRSEAPPPHPNQSDQREQRRYFPAPGKLYTCRVRGTDAKCLTQFAPNTRMFIVSAKGCSRLCPCLRRILRQVPGRFGCLGQVEHEVHVLYRLTGGTLDQVVDHRKNRHQVSPPVGDEWRSGTRLRRAPSAYPGGCPLA